MQGSCTYAVKRVLLQIVSSRETRLRGGFLRRCVIYTKSLRRKFFLHDGISISISIANLPKTSIPW